MTDIVHGWFHKWGEWGEPEARIRIYWWPSARSKTYAGDWTQMRYCTQCSRVDMRVLRALEPHELTTFMQLDRVRGVEDGKS